jgi:hypothetical protein
VNYNNRKIRPSYLRVGFEENHEWRIFKLRMDFMPSEKIQIEDDVTASVLVPANTLKYLNTEYKNSSLKFSTNCEYRFFQRPDDAVNRGYDAEAEKDLSSGNLFVTNFQPLTKTDVMNIKNDVLGYTYYSNPVKEHIEAFLNGNEEYCIISSESRIVEGSPSKNPRYLEHRSDFIDPSKIIISEMGVRFSRKIPLQYSVLSPVNAVLAGRRNNPPGEENGKKILPLSVYNPIHYQEFPELFMDFISSLTGKSPSTTGAGSEGALTKGPFNMLLPVYDLNNALLSYILGDYSVFTTPAGYIGSKVQVDHDISILVPELWSRLDEAERDPVKLISEGSFEKIEDFVYKGITVPASILGYRMTNTFCHKYLGKIFDEPQAVFNEEILKPEIQNLEAFVDGVLNIVNGHKKAASDYFEDGSIEEAIPPIKAILNIMAFGTYEGYKVEDSFIRDMFNKETILKSDWYLARLKNKQMVDIDLLQKKIENIQSFIKIPINKSLIQEFSYNERLEAAKKLLKYYISDAYLKSLIGTIGVAKIMVD